MKVHTREEPLDTLEGDLLLLPVGEGEVPLEGGAGLVDWRVEGRLSRLLQEGWAGTHDGERLLLLNVPKTRAAAAWLEGLGPLSGKGPEEVLARLLESFGAALQAGARRLIVAADGLVGPDRPFGTLLALAAALEEFASRHSNGDELDVTLTRLDLHLF